jgi:hypothetical protein
MESKTTKKGEYELIERDGVKYEIADVQSGKKVVGRAPTRSYDTPQDMLDDIGPEVMFSLAIRQIRQDHANAVRAKFNKDKVSASTVTKEIGTDAKKLIKVSEFMKAHPDVDFTEAACATLGLGPSAKPDENRIHWDVL